MSSAFPAVLWWCSSCHNSVCPDWKHVPLRFYLYYLDTLVFYQLVLLYLVCPALDLIIGRIHGCEILTIRCSTEWTLLSCIYCCCSYSLMMVRYKLMSLPAMAYPSLMNCSRYRSSLFTYESCLRSALRFFFDVCFLLLANARYSFLARLRYLLGSLRL